MSDLEDRIRQRAYELWEAEGRPDGRDADHWERARRQVMEQDGEGAAIKTGAATEAPPLGVEPITTAANESAKPAAAIEKAVPAKKTVVKKAAAPAKAAAGSRPKKS